MKKKEKPYRKLPGIRRRFLGGIDTLWAGTDHLLAIDSNRFSENYKRFYYKDIQTIIATKTVSGRIQNIIMIGLSALFLLAGYWIGGGGIVFFSILAGLVFFCLIYNTIVGPTCITRIRTHGYEGQLYSLNRLSAMRRAMKFLNPLIENVQGKAHLDQLESYNGVEYNDQQSRLYSDDQEKRSRESGTAHLFLFVTLLVLCLLTIGDGLTDSLIVTLFGVFISFAVAILLIIALIKQYTGRISNVIRWLTWTTLGYICISYIIGLIIYFSIVFKHPDAMHNQWEMLKQLAVLSPFSSDYIAACYMFLIIPSFVLGTAGLFTVYRYKNEAGIDDDRSNG